MYRRILLPLALLATACPSPEPEIEDADLDGVPADLDCDDSDAALGARSDDNDCDGLVRDEDCDDDDPTSDSNVGDLDCDGVPSADDCDDEDAALGARAGDPNCDGAQGIESITPADGAIGVGIDQELVIVFTDPVDVETLGNHIVVGGSGRVFGADYTLWGDGIQAEGAMDADGRTLRIRLQEGRWQEFRTTFWVQIDDAKNLNGNGMGQERSRFETVMVDPGYWYRLENRSIGGALDNILIEGRGERVISQPTFEPAYSGSLWTFTKTAEGGYTMTNAWLGTDRPMDGSGGGESAYMARGGINAWRRWNLTMREAFPTSGASQSPFLVELQAEVWEGAYGLGTFGNPDDRFMGRVATGSAHRFLIHNVGPKE